MTTTASAGASDADRVITALHDSHDQLAETVASLQPGQEQDPAYPTEWTIAQVGSHLGSGAEINGLLLGAGLAGAEAPDQSVYERIWETWNAKAPAEQVREGLAADARLLAAVDATTPEQRAGFSLIWFNGVNDLRGFLSMRLGEHVLHTWDIRVALDPAATLRPEATELLMGGLAEFVGMAAKPGPDIQDLVVETVAPARRLALHLSSEGSSLTPADDATSTKATLRLPAEAFVRLFYGRLDPDHTPDVESEGVDLDRLRRAFPGF